MSWKFARVGLVAGLLVAGVAGAVVYDPILDYEIRLPQTQIGRTYVQPDELQASTLLPSLSAFTNGEGAGWKLIDWNPQLGTPAAIAGPAIPMLSSGASDEAIGAAVEAFVARNQDLLRADLRDLRLAEIVTISPDRKYVIFNQYANGLEVMFGRLDVALWQGAAVLVGSEIYPDVEVNPFPALDARAAAEAAHAGIPRHPSDAVQGSPRLVILPLEPEGRPVYHLAWEILLQTHEPENVWRTYVDAHDGTLLWRQSEYSFFQINGTVRGTVEETFNDPHNYPWEDARVRASGTYTDYTDDAGNFTIEVPNNLDYSNVSEAYGSYCNVNRQDGADALLTIVGGPGDPVDFYFDDANSHPAERCAYYHVNVVHDWIKSLDPTFNGLDYVMSANVNLIGTCNAFWNGSSINFYREGGGCNNAGRIADVIYHEYGHAITQYLYAPQGAPTGSGMGEAFSDIDAMCIHRDPLVGEWFMTNGAPVRTGENLRQYPGTECGGQVHCLGEILMGAMWKSEKLFKQKYGVDALPVEYDRLYITAVKTKQTSMPNFLTRLLMADDNDGNLANGTPDYYEICDAFAVHNLPCNAITNYVSISSQEIADQPQETGNYVVTAIIQSVGGGALDPNQIQIFYTTDRTRVTWQTALMTPTGQPNEYRGEIPHQDCGSIISYYVRAAKLTGESATAPHLAPYRDVYRFMTGPMTTSLDDNLEVDQGWTLGWPGDTATQGMWERADPVGKNSPDYGDTQPENDHTAAGTNCFITDARGGLWYVYDVDGGVTSVVSPALDWSDRTGAAAVRFWYFYFDEPQNDDSLRVDLSNDNGATWTTILKKGGTGLNQWQYERAYVKSDEVAFTNQMRVRFLMEDLRTQTACAEAAIDDIQIVVNDCAPAADVVDATLPARFVVEENRPNPFNPKTSIRFGLPSAGKVDVSVFDAGGRRVRTLMDGTREAGYHTVVWDGRDDRGRAVGSGVYYYTVKTDRESQSHKMMLLK